MSDRCTCCDRRLTEHDEVACAPCLVGARGVGGGEIRKQLEAVAAALVESGVKVLPYADAIRELVRQRDAARDGKCLEVIPGMFAACGEEGVPGDRSTRQYCSEKCLKADTPECGACRHLCSMCLEDM